MSDHQLTCPQCGNTSPPQPLAGKDGVQITCRKVHLHTPKQPVEMKESDQ